MNQGRVDAAVLREPITLPGVRTTRLFAEERMAGLMADDADGNPGLAAGAEVVA